MRVAKVSFILAAVSALVAIPFLRWNRPDAHDKPVKPGTPSKPSSAMGFAPTSSQKSKKTSGDSGVVKRYRPKPVSEDVRLKVDALVNRLKNMRDEERMRDPEFARLFQRFSGMMDSLSDDSRIAKAMMSLMSTQGIDLANPAPNPDAKPKQVPGVQIPFGQLDDPVGRSWLEAVVSDDRERMEDWMVNRLEGAAFEFALDPSLQKTSEGVTVTPPATPKDSEE